MSCFVVLVGYILFCQFELSYT